PDALRLRHDGRGNAWRRDRAEVPRRGAASTRPGEVPAMTAARVSLDGVTCAYDGARAVLATVSLAIEPGAFTGIVGPSGSGKTLLLHAVLGTVQPSMGTVARRRGLRVGYVPQIATVDWSFPVTVREAELMARTSGRRLPWAS